MSETTQTHFENLNGQRFMSLTTYRKNGEGVPTPVWFEQQAGNVYLTTEQSTWKVKRIRNNPQVQVAPSTGTGTVIGPAVGGVARIISGDEAKMAHQLLRKKYRPMFGLFELYGKLRGNEELFIEIVPG